MFAFFSLKNVSINLSINFLLLELSYNHAYDISLTINSYVQDFIMIVFLLTICNCRKCFITRFKRFASISKFDFKKIVRSTNKVISSVLFFVFARFIVVTQFEKFILFS